MSDLTGYNMVLATTEDALNNSLTYAKFWQAPITYQLNPHREPSESEGLFDVQMGQPNLNLSDADLVSNQAGVTLSFTSGTLRYENTTLRMLRDRDLSGWTLYFAADIGQGAIPEDADLSALPPQVQEALSNEILSVGQLFLELETVTWSNVVITDGDGKIVDNRDIEAALENSLIGWAQSIEATLSWVLGYVITQALGDSASSDNALAELSPTSYNFSVSKYNPPGDYDSLSTLNYLMMTEGNAAPTGNTAGIFDTNWIEGPNTQDYQGAITIEGNLFNSAYVESLLLPAIASAVGATNPQITKKGTGHWNIYQYADLYGDQHEGKGQVTTDIYVETVYQDIIEELNCDVVLDPQTATYNISGTYYARTNITVQFVKWDATDSKYHGDYTLPWSFNIQLKANEGGTIQAHSSDMTQGESSQSQGGDNIGGDVFAFVNNLVDGFMNTYTADFQNKAATVTDGDFSGISGQLETAFAQLAGTVVFPAGNQFTYKDLIFTADDEQNLIAYLTYIS